MLQVRQRVRSQVAGQQPLLQRCWYLHMYRMWTGNIQSGMVPAFLNFKIESHGFNYKVLVSGNNQKTTWKSNMIYTLNYT